MGQHTLSDASDPTEGQREGGTQRPLSHSETSRALRAFIATSGIWGGWNRMVGIGTAAFTGYALWLGARDTEIAYFVSLAFFTGLAQLASSATLGRVKRKKAFIFLIGCIEISFRSSVVLIPLFLDASGRILAMAALLAMGLVCGQLVSPVYNEWMATTIPEGIRGRFIGRRTIANLVSGILIGYLVGLYIDRFPDPEKYTGFFTVFAGAILLGIGGYANLMRVPFRRAAADVSLKNLLTPFRDRRFRKLLAFFLSWNFALGIAAPFYSVFMLKTLQINYANVAILNNIFLGSMVVGYKLWGNLVDRYGSKVVLQIMVAPAVLVPILWTFNRPDNYLLIPAAMLLNGLLQAGVMVSVDARLYGILPEDRDKTSYFASWSCSFQLAFAVAPLLGGALVRIFEPVHLNLFGFPVGNLQLVFLVSAAALLVPNLFLRAVEDARETTPGQLLAQLGRGNLFGYLYGSLVYGRTGSETARARAARRMGRSKSPMALDRLIQALDDASPEVRRQAARGLGEARSREAVAPLLEELRDEESDIRTEAAEALGRIGDPGVIDPLIDALDDPDTRVQISAIRALSEMGGEEAEELLFWKFADAFDRTTFPTLADVLGRARDLRIVRPTLQRLACFRSPPIRLQLLNSVCNALGARSRFYRLISYDELTRAQRMGEMLRRTQRAFRRARALGGDVRAETLADLDEIGRAFDAGESDRLSASARELAEDLETKIGEEAVRALGTETASRIGAAVLTVRTFLGEVAPKGSAEIGDAFLVVCLWCVGDALESAK